MSTKIYYVLLIWAVLVVGAAISNSADLGSLMKTQITGGDETYTADVVLDGGKNKLAVLATTVVEQVFGQDPQATTWFFFGSTPEDANGIGSAGDTVRVEIPAAVTPLGTLYPAVDVTYVIQASDVSDSRPERAVALGVCAALNGDTDFQNAFWKCEVIKDFGAVFISSKLFNEWGQRTSWTVTCSGTTVCNEAEGDISRRGSPTELARSPNDPRQGILSIAGSVTTTPGGIGDRFAEYLMDGSSFDMLVDGSITPVDFEVLADSGGLNAKNRFIERIRCFGGGNGIKFNQFLSKSGAGGITNGIVITLISEGETFTFEPMKTTEDWKNLFATSPGTDFRIDVQSGQDQFIAQFNPTLPFILEANSGDLVRVTVQDDITSGINQLACRVNGFEQEQ